MGFKNMFDFLQTASLKDGAPAGHHAIQFIRQWAVASLHAGVSTAFEGLSPQQRALAERIVEEIEAREERPVRQIPRDRIDYYVTALSEEVQAMSRKQLGVEQGQGKDLLTRLRSVR
jgi:hypothetical protein